MNDLAELLADCEAHGIQLLPAGGDALTIDAPQDALTPNLLDWLKAYKADLLAILRVEYVDTLAADWEAGSPWDGPTKGPSGYEAGTIWPYWVRPAETAGDHAHDQRVIESTSLRGYSVAYCG